MKDLCPKPDFNFSLSTDDTRPTEPLQVPELTPQDKGEPSPVPFTLMIQKPSPDCNQDGVEKIFFRGAFAELHGVTGGIRNHFPDDNFIRFVSEAFSKHGVYRLEVVVADWSIKVYKHPNNP
jgi:hypothetical protein